MKRMGFEITGNLDHMATATNTGIHNVRHVMPEAFAELMTGATISATTTGRMPLNIAERVGLDVIVSGVRNIVAHPPPKVNAPILKNELKSFNEILLSIIVIWGAKLLFFY